jgi:hypothetical protein
MLGVASSFFHKHAALAECVLTLSSKAYFTLKIKLSEAIYEEVPNKFFLLI